MDGEGHMEPEWPGRSGRPADLPSLMIPSHTAAPAMHAHAQHSAPLYTRGAALSVPRPWEDELKPWLAGGCGSDGLSELPGGRAGASDATLQTLSAGANAPEWHPHAKLSTSMPRLHTSSQSSTMGGLSPVQMKQLFQHPLAACVTAPPPTTIAPSRASNRDASAGNPPPAASWSSSSTVSSAGFSAAASANAAGASPVGAPATRKKKKTTGEQLHVLTAEFNINTNPSSERRQELAEKLLMTPRAVQIWFQNKRAKARMEMRRNQAGMQAGLGIVPMGGPGPSPRQPGALSFPGGSPNVYTAPTTAAAAAVAAHFSQLHAAAGTPTPTATVKSEAGTLANGQSTPSGPSLLSEGLARYRGSSALPRGSSPMAQTPPLMTPAQSNASTPMIPFKKELGEAGHVETHAPDRGLPTPIPSPLGGPRAHVHPRVGSYGPSGDVIQAPVAGHAQSMPAHTASHFMGQLEQLLAPKMERPDGFGRSDSGCALSPAASAVQTPAATPVLSNGADMVVTHDQIELVNRQVVAELRALVGRGLNVTALLPLLTHPLSYNEKVLAIQHLRELAKSLGGAADAPSAGKAAARPELPLYPATAPSGRPTHVLSVGHGGSSAGLPPAHSAIVDLTASSMHASSGYAQSHGVVDMSVGDDDLDMFVSDSLDHEDGSLAGKGAMLDLHADPSRLVDDQTFDAVNQFLEI